MRLAVSSYTYKSKQLLIDLSIFILECETTKFVSDMANKAFNLKLIRVDQEQKINIWFFFSFIVLCTP